MKLTIESLSTPATFNPITFIDQVQFYNEYGVHPIRKVREEYAGRNIIVLTVLSNVYGVPEKRLLQTDLTNEDGVIHYGALFKPYTFDVGGELDGNEFNAILVGPFSTRGSCKATLETDQGVTSTFNIVTMGIAPGVLTCQNAELSASIVQTTFYEFAMTLFVASGATYATSNNYTSKENYASGRINEVYTRELSNSMYIATLDDYLLEFTFESNKTVKLATFVINGVYWYGDIDMITGEKIVFANNQSSDFPYATNKALTVYKVDTTGVFTEIGTFDEDLFKKNNSVTMDASFVDAQTEGEYFCNIVGTVYSTGTEITPG